MLTGFHSLNLLWIFQSNEGIKAVIVFFGRDGIFLDVMVFFFIEGTARFGAIVIFSIDGLMMLLDCPRLVSGRDVIFWSDGIFLALTISHSRKK